MRYAESRSNDAELANHKYLCKCYTYTKDKSNYEKIIFLASDSKEEFLNDIAEYVCEDQRDKIVVDMLDLLVVDTFGSFLNSFGVGVHTLNLTQEEIRNAVIERQMAE